MLTPRRSWFILLIASAHGVLVACTTIPEPNERYTLDRDAVRGALDQMRRTPKPLPRPLVIVDGYRSPGYSCRVLRARILELTGTDERQILAVALPNVVDTRDFADAIIQRVQERFPSNDPAQTVAVDYIGVSMGGIVGRLAALEPGPGSDGRRLRIARMFTLASPHRGAILADKIALDPAARDLRTDSPLLSRLNAAQPDAPYPLVCYARLNDTWVGATRTAPPGMEPIWVPGRAINSHFGIGADERIIADLARRLRNEEPLGQPGTPPSD